MARILALAFVVERFAINLGWTELFFLYLHPQMYFPIDLFRELTRQL